MKACFAIFFIVFWVGISESTTPESPQPESPYEQCFGTLFFELQNLRIDKIDKEIKKLWKSFEIANTELRLVKDGEIKWPGSGINREQCGVDSLLVLHKIRTNRIDENLKKIRKATIDIQDTLEHLHKLRAKWETELRNSK